MRNTSESQRVLDSNVPITTLILRALSSSGQNGELYNSSFPLDCRFCKSLHLDICFKVLHKLESGRTAVALVGNTFTPALGLNQPKLHPRSQPDAKHVTYNLGVFMIHGHGIQIPARKSYPF